MASGNPFDPFGGAAPAPAPTQGYGAPNAYASAYGVQGAMGQQPQQGQQYPSQQAYGMPQQQQQQPQYGMQQYPGMQQQQQPPAPAPAPLDPWASQAQPSQPPQQQQYQQPPQTPNPYGQQQPQVQAYQQPSPAPTLNGGYDPFSASPGPSHQMVVSQQQSNPYAAMVAPLTSTPGAAGGVQSLVPAAQQASPWGVPQTQGYGGYGAPTPAQPPAAAMYDPFAPPPAPVPAPAPPPVAPPMPAPAPAPIQPDNPFGDFLPSSPEPVHAPAPPPANDKPPTNEVAIISSQERQLQQYASGGDYGRPFKPQEERESDSRAIVPASSPVRNPYASEIARQAPPGASPLPKAELVKKSGFVLGRISFRTIVMKKWKQCYWVQYGSHTMLWFRNQGDFDDWLNNPYHNQAQRNFLIKLAVNFVHDLYKPNVRGYQVTQCRVKPYGNKMVRQFKLERWMDYGPTIAAAFGSYDPKEVDALREAIVECMRNTPLDNGIRATGAVRQAPEPSTPPRTPRIEQYENGHDNEKGNQRYNSGSVSAYTQPNPQTQRPAVASRSVVSAADLLDDHNNFDDTASLPANMGQSLVPAYDPNQGYPGAPNYNYGAPPPQAAAPYSNYAQQQPAPTPAMAAGYPQAAAPAAGYPQQQYPQQQQYQQQQAYQQEPSQQYQQYQQPPQQQYGYQQPQSYASPYPVQGAQY